MVMVILELMGENMLMQLGDGFICFSMLIWLSYSVGPWWLGVVLFVVGFLLNLVQELIVLVREK